jgi:hypothetical protein
MDGHYPPKHTQVNIDFARPFLGRVFRRLSLDGSTDLCNIYKIQHT